MSARSRPRSKRDVLLDELNLQAREMSGNSVFFQTAVAQRLGLGATDLKTLDIVLRAPKPVTAGELARRIGLTTGAVTGILDRLESAGFVRRARDRNDRRRVTVRAVLDKCRREVYPLFEPMIQAFRNMHDGYDERELELFRDYFLRTHEFMRGQIARVGRQPVRRRNG